MTTRAGVALVVLFGMLGLGAYGYWQGTSQDVVGAVRAGDVVAVKKALARDPAVAHIKVYPQAFERQSQRVEYEQRTGRSPWEGKYLIHEAAGRVVDPVPMLQALADGGADLTVRLNGRTLLHLAARDGNLEVATWLLDHGADVHAVNDCVDSCDERGQTPLHDGLTIRDDEMSVLLLERGAPVGALAASGRSALHVTGERGRLSGAFVLCRYGADPALTDAAGKTPYDLALVSASGRASNEARPEDAQQLIQWLKPAGGCAIVAASARRAGSPVSDDDARKVFGETVAR